MLFNIITVFTIEGSKVSSIRFFLNTTVLTRIEGEKFCSIVLHFLRKTNYFETHYFRIFMRRDFLGKIQLYTSPYFRVKTVANV